MTRDESEVILASAALQDGNLPVGYDNYADVILVANGKPPDWLGLLPPAGIIWALAYYLSARAFDRVNLVFAIWFLVWLIYTPVARKRGWFFVPMS